MNRETKHCFSSISMDDAICVLDLKASAVSNWLANNLACLSMNREPCSCEMMVHFVILT